MMMGKFVFKTKKLLSLLSFGVLFFVVMEIWLSHKKMDALGPKDGKRIGSNKDNMTPSIRKRGEDFNHAKKKPSRVPNVHASNLNNIYESHEVPFTEFDDIPRNRTDFKGGGDENDGENEGDGENSANYGESEYDGPDDKENYEFREQNHISCKINGDYIIHCLREGNEVYVPFSFIKKYFEISGELILNRKGIEELVWKHSYAKVYEMSQMEARGGRKKRIPSYRHDGVFMSFEHYRVEIRDRVKCISAREGVPISKQWGAQGYFYPIQIAQFGLSHYSKMLMEPERQFHPLGFSKSDWMFVGIDVKSGEFEADKKAYLNVESNSFNKDFHKAEIHFNISEGLGPNIFYYLNIPKNFSILISSENFDFLSFEIKCTSNASLTVVFETKMGEEYKIHYISSDETFLAYRRDIYYGMGTCSEWLKLTRDLKIDLQKSIPKKLKKKLSSKLFPLSLMRLELRGGGYVRNIQLSNQDHLSLFYHSANWMVKNQDSRGGWPIPVSRVLVKEVMSLKPGWYSAMAQGHAMSLLSRAYSLSRNPTYLRAAYQAINPFLVKSSDGGVLAYLFGQYPWYEEYPTSPPSFVINGFMYALFGLYDLAKTLESVGIASKTSVLEDGFTLDDVEWLKKLNSNSDKGLSNTFMKMSSQIQSDKSASSFLIDNMSVHFPDISKPFHNTNLTSNNYGNRIHPEGLAGTRNLVPRDRSFVQDDEGASPNEIPNLLNPADYESVQDIKQNEILNNLPTLRRNENRSKQIKRLEMQMPSVEQPDSNPQMHSLFPKEKDVSTAKWLFETGLKTLKLALPLFDSGSGSFYDLRHFSVPGCAPNRARWDYHSTHISQLIMASAIDEDPQGKDFFQKTISRWISYMKGKRAPHN